MFWSKRKNTVNATEESIREFPDQILEAIKLGKGHFIKKPESVQNIVIIGMGGSAIAGHLLSAVTELHVPLVINKGYDIPDFVDEYTLIFAVSYSGNTEETISAYRQARKKQAQIIAITSGGKLEQLSRMNENEIVLIPKGYQPRAALAYLFFPMAVIMEHAGYMNLRDDIHKLVKTLKNTPFEENAKHVTEKLAGKIPLIYTSDKMQGVGYRWKCQFNENSKLMAFSHVLPEMNHNEIVGFDMMYGDFIVLVLKDEQDHGRIKDRIKVMKEVIGEKVKILEIMMKGQSRLCRVFSAVHLGDWISYYLAVNRNVDPTPVHIIENIKKML